MAKQPPSKGGTSRIRFIMLDAELQEGDLSQITSAIQNALKPTIIQHRLPSQAATPVVIGNNGGGEIVDEDPVEVEAEASAEPKAPRSPRVRKPTTPNVLDLDLTSDVALESFAKQHPAESASKRNLVIAAWFKVHRNVDAVTADHVYTCYRHLNWPTGVEDFSSPLRHLKKDKLMSSPSRGEYAINHLGLDRVRKMAKGSE